jgi:hypothetical protein
MEILLNCELCGNAAQHGPQRYELKKANGYNLWVCQACWESNHDGWNPMHEKFLFDHLSKNGLPIPNRNVAGLFPRESYALDSQAD